MGINIFLFVWFYFFYDLGEQFYYTRHLLGVSWEHNLHVDIGRVKGGDKEAVCPGAHHTAEPAPCLCCSLALVVCPGLGQSSCCRAQLQLSAHSAAGVSEPAVFGPGLVYGNLKLLQK